jgi:hypothetical protein
MKITITERQDCQNLQEYLKGAHDLNAISVLYT